MWRYAIGNNIIIASENMMDIQEIINLKREILRLKLDKFINLGLIMDYHPEIDSEVYIYGAGVIGKKLFSCFEKPPKGFIDKNETISKVCGINVFRYDQIHDINANDIIIVTPTWEYEIIRDMLLKEYKQIKVINLEELVKEL